MLATRMRLGGGPSGVVTVTPRVGMLQDSGGGPAFTFTSTSLPGSSNTWRYILVDAIARNSASGATVSSMTLNGASMSLLAAYDEQQMDDAYMAHGAGILRVPSSTSATIVITFSETVSWCVAQIYAVYNLKYPTTVVNKDKGRNAATTVTLSSFNIPSDGAGFFCGANQSDNNKTLSWTGATESSEANLDGDNQGFAYACDSTGETGTSDRIFSQGSYDGSRHAVIGFTLR